METTQTATANERVVTVNELADLLAASRAGTIVTLVYTSTPRMRKTKPRPNPWWTGAAWTLRKEQRVQGMIGARYANAVNNQRLREAEERAGVVDLDDVPTFEPEPRAWGERVEGTPLVEHKGRTYLEMLKWRTLDVVYIDDSESEVPYSAVEPFMSPRRRSGRQGTDKEIRVRDFRLDRIDQIALGGVTYYVR